MLPLLLAGALIAAEPSPCPSDLVVTNPRIKVVRANDRAYDNNIITVDVRNNGNAGQPETIRQHLDVLIGDTVAGSQTIPPLGPNETYAAAFRIRLKHESKRDPIKVTFHFMIDSKTRPGENCTTANDRLTVTL